MEFVENSSLFAERKNFANRSRIDKVIAMVRVAHCFDSRCISRVLLTELFWAIFDCPDMLVVGDWYWGRSYSVWDRILGWHCMWKAWCLAHIRLFSVHVSALYSRTDITQVEYMQNFVVTLRLRCFQTSSKSSMTPAVTAVTSDSELVWLDNLLPKYTNSISPSTTLFPSMIMSSASFPARGLCTLVFDHEFRQLFQHVPQHLCKLNWFVDKESDVISIIQVGETWAANSDSATTADMFHDVIDGSAEQGWC